MNTQNVTEQLFPQVQTFLVILANEFGSTWAVPCRSTDKESAASLIASDQVSEGCSVVEVQYTH